MKRKTRVVPFRKPLRRPAAWSRGRRKPSAAQTLLGRPRRWIGMLMRTMVPSLSVFLLLAVALTFGDFSGTGATLGPAVGIDERDGAITGRANVVDGDTVEIHGQRIRLTGIDAPKSGQLCFRADDKPWRCGQQAALALADKIGQAPVTCRRTDTDRYGRMVAVCFQGDEDLNAWMVGQGWAVAYRRYSRAYVAHENEAKAAGAGIWPSRFVMPWDWRRGHRVARHDETAARPDGCVIKGNINRQGKKIYHVPGGRWYAQTRIDESRGQRWFCSEAEARAAGWRKAQQ